MSDSSDIQIGSYLYRMEIETSKPHLPSFDDSIGCVDLVNGIGVVKDEVIVISSRDEDEEPTELTRPIHDDMDAEIFFNDSTDLVRVEVTTSFNDDDGRVAEETELEVMRAIQFSGDDVAGEEKPALTAANGDTNEAGEDLEAMAVADPNMNEGSEGEEGGEEEDHELKAAIKMSLDSNGRDDEEPLWAAILDMPLLDQLTDLDSADVILNMEPFLCAVCLCEALPGNGVTLKDCLHAFCRCCLADTVKHSDEAEVRCPYSDASYVCDSVLRQTEVRALVSPEIFDDYLLRSISLAESRTRRSLHCKTPDCIGWCEVGDNVTQFLCPVCSMVNCLSCHAIHEDQSCAAYQDSLLEVPNATAGNTQFMEEMIQWGTGMYCPACDAFLEKNGGCDWIICTLCKTEICWITGMTRWGPGGKGDTSGGCRCGVDGIKCHKDCSHCH